MNKSVSLFLASIVLSLAVGIRASAEESTVNKADDAKNKAVDNVKSTARGAEDKACEMVNGKMQCAGKKVAHKVSNLKDKVNTTVQEGKNKAE